MKKEHKREIVQLWYIANHYFNLAMKIKRDNKLTSNALQITVKELADKCQSISDIRGVVAFLMKINAHLGSCAIRLNTIEERLRLKSERWKCYESLEKKKAALSNSDITGHIDIIMHILLRHNVAHEEYHQTKKPNPAHKIMQDKLMKLKMEELLENMFHVKKDIKADIRKNGIQI